MENYIAVPSIDDLRNDVRSGAIPREEYWTAMYDHHKSLYQYQSLLKNSEVKQIEIDSDELRLLTHAGSKFVWLPDDLRIAPSLLVNYGKYEQPETQFLLAAAKDASLVIDIGANIGWYAVNIARASYASGCVVHAFEPVPLTYRRLLRNIEINDLGARVVANNFGLADKPGELTMFVPSFNGSGAASLARLHPDDESVEVTVELRTLDAYCSGAGITKIDLIKCDVEGAELFVMRGGASTIARDKPVIFVELLRKWSKAFGYHPNDVIALLATFGYTAWCLRDGRIEPVPTIDDATIETNFIFLQPGKHDDLRNFRVAS
jgi:FkbM family methyltransferase